MVFMRPTFEAPNCASGMPSSPANAQGMLVAHSISSPQMPVDELMDVAEVLQQLPALVERRSDQLDQRLGEIGGDVLIGERRAERRRVRGSAAMLARGRTRSDSFSTPLRPPRSTPRSPELMSPASRRSNFLSTTLRITPVPRPSPLSG